MKYTPLYAVAAVFGFLLGWRASDWLSTFADEYDPRVEGRW
ncbi:hypothetical protein [Mycobacteroides abscessus]|nr:hypothetical protein [Mycobacteroides abscessus]DAZ90361.1 TPA_asm: membrane protein [Mycobacterium phage prophiFSQJ01-1]SII41649.1 Uncharacterised protein [Mycobacteroides abscessus subsp. abscessus]SIK13488.1 Uncharacterised protein [Mycobacteroides abscessus subsp. abscessus]SIN25769.1 Uncharacterised protein [Mycobacteroides abscessus subsp. abscessus]SLI51178.1 Uncharacterised protein [Mycobacteroides abscessus subsp. abscessus]